MKTLNHQLMKKTTLTITSILFAIASFVGEIFLNNKWKKDNLWIITEDTTTAFCCAFGKLSFENFGGKILIKL